MTKMLVATKEIKVTINGVEYECLLVPTEQVIDVDFRQCPENHPKIKRLIEKVKRGEEI